MIRHTAHIKNAVHLLFIKAIPRSGLPRDFAGAGSHTICVLAYAHQTVPHVYMEFFSCKDGKGIWKNKVCPREMGALLT